jgi:hypothetical protein
MRLQTVYEEIEIPTLRVPVRRLSMPSVRNFAYLLLRTPSTECSYISVSHAEFHGLASFHLPALSGFV